MFEIEFKAIDRVLGEDVAERFNATAEEFSDGADAPALLCMAFERWQADPTRSLDQHMTDLLDAYDAR